MSEYFSLSLEGDKVKLSEVKDCTCDLKGTLFNIDKKDKVKILNRKEKTSKCYGYVVIWKINEHFEIKDYSSHLSECFCKFFKDEGWVIDGPYVLLKIIYKVDADQNISILSVKA